MAPSLQKIPVAGRSISSAGHRFPYILCPCSADLLIRAEYTQNDDQEDLAEAGTPHRPCSTGFRQAEAGRRGRYSPHPAYDSANGLAATGFRERSGTGSLPGCVFPPWRL